LFVVCWRLSPSTTMTMPARGGGDAADDDNYDEAAGDEDSVEPPVYHGRGRAGHAVATGGSGPGLGLEVDRSESAAAPGTSTSHHQQPSLPSRSQWMERERKKQLRLLYIQQRIMESVGFHRPPDMSAVQRLGQRGSARLQVAIDRLGARAEGGGSERTLLPADYLAKRIQAILPTCPEPVEEATSDDGVPAYKLHFSIDLDGPSASRHRQTRLWAATLKLRKKPRPASVSRFPSQPDRVGQRRRGVTSETPADNLSVAVYSFTFRSSRRAARKATRRLIKTQTVRADFSGWLSISVNSTVDSWMQQQQPRGSFGIEIVVTDASTQLPVNPTDVFEPQNCSVRSDVEAILLPMAIEDETETSDASLAGGGSSNDSIHQRGEPGDDAMFGSSSQPFLELVTVDVPRSSASRSRHQRSAVSHPGACQLETVYVSFADLGWNDWIIQPQGFETGICVGTCDRYADTEDLSKVLDARPDGADKPVNDGCCMPSRLKPLGVVYYSRDARLSMTFLDDLIITECACRSI
jgi:hypothetical protein